MTPDDLIFLDAEDLAEGGLASAYQALLPRLRAFVPAPEPLRDARDEDSGRYVAWFRDRPFVIFDPGDPEAEEHSWGRAAVVLFGSVNAQLEGSEYRFYAINGGNELAGTFLTARQAAAVRDAAPRRTDWPYLPVDEPPWYGQPH